MGEGTHFTVAVETHDDSAVVRVEGELDMATVASFEEALTVALERPHVIVDLGSATFLDSAGVRAIASAARQAERVSVVATDPGIVRVLEITGMDSALSVHPSLEDAR